MSQENENKDPVMIQQHIGNVKGILEKKIVVLFPDIKGPVKSCDYVQVVFLNGCWSEKYEYERTIGRWEFSQNTNDGLEITVEFLDNERANAVFDLYKKGKSEYFGIMCDESEENAMALFALSAYTPEWRPST